VIRTAKLITVGIFAAGSRLDIGWPFERSGALTGNDTATVVIR